MIHLLSFTLLATMAVTAHARTDCKGNNMPSDNPAYPAVKVYESVVCDPRPGNKELIKRLEALLIHKSFKLPVEKDGQTYKLHVGTNGSFSLWRDLINLNLGRAYYEEGELKKAMTYWDSIVTGSQYFPMAVLEGNYALMKLKDYKRAQSKLSLLKNHAMTAEIAKEAKLQEAMLELRAGKFLEAYKLVEHLKFETIELEELRLKALAEGLFSHYLGIHTGQPFSEKVKTLKIITNAVDAIRPANRDGQLVYLAAEAYWHTAVAYRIEDPDKHQSFWHKQLEIADDWISPWVDKSIANGKAELNEEAFFFSIALLWEREFHKKALIRLKALDKIYPQGVYREDSYQLLGDYYFDQHDFNAAIPYYRQLAQIGSESKAAYGVYKAAWSFYNAKDKWKSLRHFERLFQFYLDKKGVMEDEKNELMKEARQDLLLVISEILPSAKGIEELKTFKLPALETKLMVRDLAKLYQRNGNYKDSTLTWSYLLNNHLADVEAPQWIIELALDNYADGKRNDISHAIKQYYLPWKAKHFTAEGDKHLATEWTKLILSLHREAKKSEDPLFWKATDIAYETYEELRPDGQEGEVWYFGAQKFQFQNNLWKSVEWFKRAADVKGFLQAEDAALSALGLLNDKSGDLSIIENKAQLKDQYRKLAAYSKWFFDRPSEKLAKQKELAHFLYSESLFFTGDYLKAREFLTSLFNNPEQNEETWKVYLSHNGRLYSSKVTLESYELALILQQTKLGKEKEKQLFLADVAQENAFQLAYQAEKSNPVDLKSLRHWYEISYAIPLADEAIKIKAWHNYFLSFNHQEAKLFEEKLQNFVSEWNGKAPKDAPTQELQFNIYAKALKVFEAAKLPHKKGPYLHLASLSTSDTQLKESLLWDAVVLHASFHQWSDFSKRLSDLEEMKSDYVKEPKYLTAIAKFHFYQGDYDKAWDMVKAMVSSPDAPAGAWLVLSDLYYKSHTQEVTEFISKNEKQFKDVVWIRPLWAKVKENDFMTASDLTSIKVERQPAAVTPEDSEATIAFKERLASIGSTYKLMNLKKDKLKSAVITWIPATGVHAVCLAPGLTKEAYLSLAGLKKVPVASEQWPQFVSKLEEKEAELQAMEQKETALCEKVKDDTLFVGNFAKPVSPFCKEAGCMRSLKIDHEEIVKIDSDVTEPKDKFFAFLAQGAWAQAETLAALETDKNRQAYYHAILRLAADDIWNAYVLLEDLQKAKGWEERSSHLKYIIAKSNHREDYAIKFKTKKEIELSPMELKLLSKAD